MNKIIIKDLNKFYGKNQSLNNINLTINSGEIFGVVGGNGSGKSTLFKILSGMLKADSGVITYNNRIINKESNSIFRKMGVLIEEPAFYTYLTGKENLKIILKLHGLNESDYINKVNNIIDIEKLLKVKYKSYSMGMRQKLGIAAAIIHNPEIIILDEPTNSLDITAIDEVKRMIMNFKQKNKIVIISSHILSDIKELCDKVVILKDGNVIDTFTKKGIKDKIENLYSITVDFNAIEVLDKYDLDYKTDNKGLTIYNKNLNYILDMLKLNNVSIIDINKNRELFQEYVKERIENK